MAATEGACALRGGVVTVSGGSTGDRLIVTTPYAVDQLSETLPEPASVVQDWLNGGDLVPQVESLRANRLALLPPRSAQQAERIAV
jgi:hypothetical protein